MQIFTKFTEEAPFYSVLLCDYYTPSTLVKLSVKTLQHLEFVFNENWYNQRLLLFQMTVSVYQLQLSSALM